jgi:hypothetical protein
MTENSAFSTKSCCGTIELKHFCGVAIGQEKTKWNKRYIAQVYSYTHEEGRKLIKNVHVPVFWDLELYRKVVKKCYSKEGTEDGPRMKINIVSDELSLDIGQPPAGWNIEPLVQLKMLREDIDSYNAGTAISAFQMMFRWIGDGPPLALCHKIFLKGVKLAGSFFNVIINSSHLSPPSSPATFSSPNTSNIPHPCSAAHSELNGDQNRVQPEAHPEMSGAEAHVQPDTEKYLDGDDFFDVYKELKPVAAHWEGIWLALRLPFGDCHTTRNDCNGNADRCLRATVEKWLNRNYNTDKHGKPSWKMLVQAVADPCGGEHKAHAEQIAQKHGVPLEDIRHSST